MYILYIINNDNIIYYPENISTKLEAVYLNNKITFFRSLFS